MSAETNASPFRAAVAHYIGTLRVEIGEGSSEFSSCACDSCGSTLAGSRHDADGIDDDPGDVIPLDLCVDCLFFHAYGDEPKEWGEE